MSRRKSRGTVEQRNGRWWLRIRVETPTQVAGKTIRSRERVDIGPATELRSRVDARRAADGWLGRNQPWQLQHGRSIGFSAYAEVFLREHAALYRDSTRRNYAIRIRRHLVPELGALPLWRISPAVIREVLASRREAGLRRSTLQGVRAVLLQLLRQARKDDYDAQTIETDLVRLPTEDIAEREERFVSEPELAQILAGSNYPWRALWAVLGLAGLRISEALGLTWAHIDLTAAPLLRIRQGACGGQLLPLKTATSRAELPLDPALAAILADYKTVWTPNPTGLLFATRTGKPRDYRDIRVTQLQPLLQRLGLPPAGFHAFRHGLPRRLFAAGCSAAAVQQLMRHGSMRMTERYTHSTAEDLRAAITSAGFRKSQPRPAVPLSDHATQEIQP